ncbi:hypothetical protein D3C77_326880 [compost metagenome]
MNLWRTIFQLYAIFKLLSIYYEALIFNQGRNAIVIPFDIAISLMSDNPYSPYFHQHKMLQDLHHLMEHLF